MHPQAGGSWFQVHATGLGVVAAWVYQKARGVPLCLNAYNTMKILSFKLHGKLYILKGE